MSETDQAGPSPEGGDVGRAFIIVDRGNVAAEIERRAGPGGVRESDLFVVIVPVPPPARASLHDAGGANVAL